jgi:16S rRNA processing protein RimM
MREEQLHIATVGKTVGLDGFLKLHIHTDFPEQFFNGAVFQSDKGAMKIEGYDEERGLVAFFGYESVEESQVLVNRKLYTTLDQTRKVCQLGDEEYFWFDIEGLMVVENEQLLGQVIGIERLSITDYLLIQTEKSLQDRGFATTFLLPYVDRYIQQVDTDQKTINVIDAIDILENS